MHEIANGKIIIVMHKPDILQETRFKKKQVLIHYEGNFRIITKPSSFETDNFVVSKYNHFNYCNKKYADNQTVKTNVLGLISNV